jgi:uncharacterized protein YjfI (DUF2170 family)
VHHVGAVSEELVSEMTISEVVELFQKIKDEYGDLPVYVLFNGMEPMLADKETFLVEEPDRYWEVPLRLEVG